MSIAVDSTNMDTQISITVARSQARKMTIFWQISLLQKNPAFCFQSLCRKPSWCVVLSYVIPSSSFHDPQILLILVVSSSTIDNIYEIYTFYENRYEIYIFYENLVPIL